jgi:hypothetical protein
MRSAFLQLLLPWFGTAVAVLPRDWSIETDIFYTNMTRRLYCLHSTQPRNLQGVSTAQLTNVSRPNHPICPCQYREYPGRARSSRTPSLQQPTLPRLYGEAFLSQTTGRDLPPTKPRRKKRKRENMSWWRCSPNTLLITSTGKMIYGVRYRIVRRSLRTPSVARLKVCVRVLYGVEKRNSIYCRCMNIIHHCRRYDSTSGYQNSSPPHPPFYLSFSQI